MTLKWQIALALAVIALFVGTAAATGSYVTTARRLDASVEESLRSTVAALPEAGDGRGPDGGHGPGGSGDTDGKGRDGSDCPQAGALEPASAAQLVSATGEVTTCIAGAPRLPTTTADRSVPYGQHRLTTVSSGGKTYRVLTTSWPGGGVIQVGRDLDESQRVLSSLRLELAGLTLAGVAVALALGWLLARRITRPIVRLRDTAESIATTQDLGTEIPSGGSGEVGSLAASFTAMVRALRLSRDQQQRLVDDASHEMRTPLTSLTTNVEHLHHVERIPASERTEMLDAVQADVGELTHLLTEMVELATDRSGEDEAVEPLDLGALARQVAARAERRTGRAVTVHAARRPDDAPNLVAARPQMVERAVSNLVDNALKYSPDGAPVEITVEGPRLEVHDHGRGIAPADRPLVWDRFYRAVEARTQPGSGLGLAIVRQIVERHHGTVWIRSDPGGGAVVGFQLEPGGVAGPPA